MKRQGLPRHVPVGQLRRSLDAVQRFRLNFVFFAMIVLYAGLLGRLAVLQVVQADVYGAQARKQHGSRHEFQGLRGRIVDARGRPLVTSRRVLRIAVDPSVVEDPRLFAQRLAPLLDLEGREARILRVFENAPEGSRYRVLEPEVDEPRLIRHLALLDNYRALTRAGLYGLLVEWIEKRTYINGDYAAHVLGRADGAACGVESALDDCLEGQARVVAVDADQRRRGLSRGPVDISDLSGGDVQLTLDIVIQHHLEKALDDVCRDWSPKLAVGIVMDPRTGAVLALANRPTFDPRGRRYQPNSAVQGRFPPGSLFKPFTVAEALRIGVVDAEGFVPTPPVRHFRMGRAHVPVTDSHDVSGIAGGGTVLHVLAHSSNTGVAHLAWGFGPEGMRQLTAGLGFDQPLPFELGDVAVGYAEPKARWNVLYPTLTMAYGQGVAVSPLRLISAFAGFARDDGRTVLPTLVPGGGGPRRDLPRVCATPADLAVVRAGLEACVDEGTARRAFAGCRYPVAGKTGTAEELGTGARHNFAGFIGYAPRERPRLLVLVMAKVDESQRHGDQRPYGANVAGPAVRALVEKTLDYWGPEPSGAGEAVRPSSPSGPVVPGREDDR